MKDSISTVNIVIVKSTVLVLDREPEYLYMLLVWSNVNYYISGVYQRPRMGSV